MYALIANPLKSCSAFVSRSLVVQTEACQRFDAWQRETPGIAGRVTPGTDAMAICPLRQHGAPGRGTPPAGEPGLLRVPAQASSSRPLQSARGSFPPKGRPSRTYASSSNLPTSRPCAAEQGSHADVANRSSQRDRVDIGAGDDPVAARKRDFHPVGRRRAADSSHIRSAKCRPNQT